MLQSIDELVQNRKDWVESNRKNNFHDGIKRLLTELYPDNAHFIYELLQNAEDTHAKTVRFTLADDAIEFEHDGDRLFNLNDVESITSIGTSTKSDDPTSIGKFGVGFKAVFAYTDTPEIHSGDYHFRIRDLVIPEIDRVAKANVENRETRFIFPFDHSKKRPEKAVAEIEHGLRVLGDNTLLFLNHIHKLEYLLPEGSLGSFECINHEDEHIEIRSSHPNSEDTVSHWLRFEKVVEITDEDGESKSCRIAVAYKLDKNDSKKKNQKKSSSPWKISPLDYGQVSIFFPAEKETSNLKFHLHAPFASTVARDSVRDCEANDQLRDCLAELVVESLIDIRDKGMLTMGFLAVLPNEMDNLPSFYEPIRDAIVQAFKDEKLTPTRKGGHAPAMELYRGPKKIDDVLGVDGLLLLTNGEARPWAANPPQLNQRDAYFLDSLKIDSWEWWDLCWALSHLDEDEQEALETWIAQKDDAWVMRFYALLGDACDTHDECADAKSLRIVRVESEQGDKHVLSKDAFFSSEEEMNFPVDILLVKPSVYKSKIKKQYARLFLEEIGVRDFDERAAIELRLGCYASRDSRPASRGTKHYQDLKLFVIYWKKNPADVELFKRHQFLLGTSVDETLYWCTPERLCVDAPYLETGLVDLRSIHKKYVVSNFYEEKLNKILPDFVEFIKAIGVVYRLDVEKVSTINNPHKDDLRRDYSQRGVRWTSSSIDEDYTIEKINMYFNFKDRSVSRLIWNAIIQADKRSAYACFRPNKSYKIRIQESQLIFHLRTHAWLPDKSGNFRKPQEITKDDLPIEFPYDDRNGLLTAIGFGAQARDRSEEYNKKNHRAQSIGFKSADEAEVMIQIAEVIKETGKSPKEFLEQLKPTVNQPLFPEHSVTNPERREERFAEQHADAPEKNYEKRQRKVRTTAGIIDPAVWLRNQYTNESDQMICQICQKEMPFKKRNGEYFFEAVEIFTKGSLLKEDEAQFLALCPLCAAMYKEFIKKDENAQANLKMELFDADDYDVPLKLGEQKASIRFVETHFHDLKVILADL